MTVIGITGPSGAGKGMATKIICAKYHFIPIDADEIYHSLVSVPSPCVSEISESFGTSVLTHDGALNRKELATKVLGCENRDKLLLLNKIAHKHVVKAIKDLLVDYRIQNISCIIDAPLLIEAGLCSDCDITVSVLADRDTRIKRIMKRDGISYDRAATRISSQNPDSFYIENTDFTIYNNGNAVMLTAAIDKIMSERNITA